MGFWWEEPRPYNQTHSVPSLDTGFTNAKNSRTDESVFESENFKNISSMFDEVELSIAKYKSQNRTNEDIAEILNIPVLEVSAKINEMLAIYRKTFPVETSKTNYRTISSKKR